MNVNLDMDRRVLLRRALLLVGAAAMPVGAEALAAAASTGKRLLDAPRFALLTALADTIVPATDTPGAVVAGVPANVDALLRNWASPTRRTDLIGALDAIDVLAKRGKGKAFAALSPAEREALLVPHDAAALKVVPRPAPPPTTPVAGASTVVDPRQGKTRQGAAQTISLLSGPPVADPAYGKLKELIVTLFYYSETALTHDLPYEHAPGKWEPSIPVTPQTRPYGGAGLM